MSAVFDSIKYNVLNTPTVLRVRIDIHSPVRLYIPNSNSKGSEEYRSFKPIYVE